MDHYKPIHERCILEDLCLSANTKFSMFEGQEAVYGEGGKNMELAYSHTLSRRKDDIINPSQFNLMEPEHLLVLIDSGVYRR